MKRMLALMMALVLALTLVACGTPVLQSAELEETVFELKKGESASLVPQFHFDKEDNSEAVSEATATLVVTYSSSDEKVATVDEQGTITAVGSGSATITASVATDDSTTLDTTASVTVTVPVESITAVETLKLYPNDTTEGNVNAKVLPTDATEQEITYTSSDPKVATVDKTGKVTLVDIGKATITSTCGEFIAKTEVICAIKVTGLTLAYSSGSVYVGGTTTITVYTEPFEADEIKCDFKSADTKIATVNDEGVVTGVAAGTTKITVSGEGCTTEYSITVKGNGAATPTTPSSSTPSGPTLGESTTPSGGGTTPSGGDTTPTPTPTPTPEPTPTPTPEPTPTPQPEIIPVSPVTGSLTAEEVQRIVDAGNAAIVAAGYRNSSVAGGYGYGGSITASGCNFNVDQIIAYVQGAALDRVAFTGGGEVRAIDIGGGDWMFTVYD